MLPALQHIVAGLGFHVDVATFTVLFGLLLARMAAAIAFTPFLGGQAVASTIKIGLAVVISILLFPSVAPLASAGAADLNSIRVICLLIKEAVIGATLGFLTQIIFHGVQMAGAMVDYQRGMSQATFFAPQLESNVSLLGQLQLQAALVLFLILNGHLLFLRALADSYRAVPLLDFPHFAGGTLADMELMGRYTANCLLIAIQLSAPALLALFLVDIGFGMLGKAASGFHVHNESQPVKALVGLGVVLLAMAYIMNRIPAYFTSMLNQIGRLVAGLS